MKEEGFECSRVALNLFALWSLSHSQAPCLAATRQKLRARPKAEDSPGAKCRRLF